ncbi:MAG: hypothetical protein ACRDRV_00615 [Pseudonocardiaceae bacterium]
MCAYVASVAARRARDQGDAYLSQGDFVAAERSFTDVLGHLGPGALRHSASAVVVAAAHIGLGRVSLGRGDPVQADAEFAAALKAQPDSWQGFYWVACAAAHRADYPRAEWNYTEALRRRPELTRALVQRAYVRLRQHADNAALADLALAAEQGMLDENAYLVMALLHLRGGEWDRAQAVLDGVQSPSRAPLVAALRAFAGEQQGNRPDAFAGYQRAVARADVEDWVLFRHGRLALRLGHGEGSVRSWTALHRRYPQHPALRQLTVLANRAWAGKLVAQQDFGSAIECLQRCEPFEPPGALDAVLVELHLRAAAQAMARDGLGGLAAARRHLGAAEDRRGDDHRVLHSAALVEFLSGAHRAAAQLWVRLRRARPGDPRVRHALALCAIRLGELDQAEHDLGALSGAADTPAARRAARALAALQVRRGRWCRAAEILELITGDDPWRDAVLAECRYRSGQIAGGQDARLGPWLAACHTRAGRLDTALELLGQTDDGAGRARRELGLLLRKAALAQVPQQRWESAAALLATSRELSGARPGFALLDAVVCVLGGRRTAALEILSDASRRAPADYRVTHALALAQLHSLGSGEQTGASWPRCIAAWGAIVQDGAFWRHWHGEAERRYRTRVSASDVELSCNGLRNLLRARLGSGGSGEGSHPGHVGDAGPELPFSDGSLLQREIDAARILDELGGFPVPAVATRALVCGPLRIAQLGLAEEFGTFARRLAAQCDEQPAGSSNGRGCIELRRCFSQLGVAHCHLGADRPAQALAVLADLRCAHCVAAAAGDDAGSGQAVVADTALCTAKCGWFDAHNPAYAGWDDKHHRLARDASALAVEVLLRLAQDGIAADELNPVQVSAHWREAISRGTGLGSSRDVQDEIVKVALGRARTLERRGDIEDAIVVLGLARKVTDASVRSRIDGRLASLFAGRGISIANADRDRIGESVDDLRRALALNRHLIWARLNLCKALRVYAGVLAERRSDRSARTKARILLQEAISHCDTGLASTPGHRELAEERDKASVQLAILDEEGG